MLWCAPALTLGVRAAGETAAESPERVRLRFSEPVDTAFGPVKVYDFSGERIDEDDARKDPGDARGVEVGLVDLLELGPLRAMPAEQRDGLRVWAVRRFSRVAIRAVTVVVLTGAYATLLHLPDLSALIGMPYGRALLIKLGMLVLVLATGGINLMLAGREPFERLIWFELILALGIFVATGFLTSLPPPSNT